MLANFNLVAFYDKEVNVYGLQREISDDSFAGDEIHEVLAPYVRTDDSMLWRDQVDVSYYMIAFDGRGSYCLLDGGVRSAVL